ncbi:MAG: C40 family peptidase [Muribaculaceae bacterium]|nr:C40 family peptidase [Muribaculaceae bacterium]
MNTLNKYIYRTSCALIIVGAFSSCGSHKSSVHPPKNAKEISLNDLIGGAKGGSNSAQPAVLTGDATAVIEAAKRWIGTKYLYGGTTKSGVDCSALIMNSFREGCNLKLPRTSAAQRQYSANISKKDLLPGDLVFFTSRRKGASVAHVGLYIGDGKIIHASSSRGVIISRLSETYYAQHYHSAGRVLKHTPLRAEPVAEVIAITPEILRADSIAELQAEALDQMLEMAIDSIYASDPF